MSNFLRKRHKPQVDGEQKIDGTFVRKSEGEAAVFNLGKLKEVLGSGVVVGDRIGEVQREFRSRQLHPEIYDELMHGDQAPIRGERG